MAVNPNETAFQAWEDDVGIEDELSRVNMWIQVTRGSVSNEW